VVEDGEPAAVLVTAAEFALLREQRRFSIGHRRRTGRCGGRPRRACGPRPGPRGA
jgi:hypothetical protein